MTTPSVDASVSLDAEHLVDAAQRIEPRRLIPTVRQGIDDPSDAKQDFVWTMRPEKERYLRSTLRDFVGSLNLRKIEGPRTPLLVFVSFAICVQLIDSLFGVIVPELRTTFAAGPAAIGVVSVIAFVMGFVVQPFYGWLVDRTSRVRLVRITYFADGLLSAASAFAATILGFVGIRATSGLVGQGAQAPTATLLADYYDGASFARAVSFINAAPLLAVVLGPIVGGALVATTNWRVAIFALSLLTVVASIGTLFLREPRRGEAERRSIGATSEEQSMPLSFRESWRAARSVATLRRIWYATIFTIPLSRFPSAIVLAVFLGQRLGLDPIQRGYVAAVVGAAGFFGLTVVAPIAGRRLEHAPSRVMTLAGFALAFQGIGLILLGATSNLALAIIAAIPIGLGVALVPTLTSIITLKVVPPRIRGLGISTTAPWAVGGLLLFSLILASAGINVQVMVLMFVPVAFVGALILITGGANVERDIRAARASVLAETAVREAKEAGRSKLLVARGVEATFGAVQVLFGVDLDVEEGEIVALLGTNGAGKSTLLRAIVGIHHASNGAILVDGKDVTHELSHLNAARGVVMMPGGKATFPTLSVRENLRAAAWLYRNDTAACEAGMEHVLELFPILRDRLDQPAGNLSGGEQQMVGLGQAFLMRPRLLMIDELSLGLAPAVVESLMNVLRAVHAQGATIILVEQSVNVALTIAPRAVFMEKGQVRFDGPTSELLRRPDLIRSVFIGASSRPSKPVARARGRSHAISTERTATLDVEHISVSFGGVRALDDVSASVSAGEVVGIVGPNGAGKTTLFDIISGFVPADSGRIVLDTTDLTRLSPDRRARLGVGRSFQNVHLFPALTVRQNIAVAFERRAVTSEISSALWLPHVRASEGKIFRRVDGLIEILGLEAFANKFALELSTGTRRAVEVACVMAAEPNILLLDEPSSGLAQAETEELGPVLLRLVQETGAGLLIIEHDIPLISSISDRLIAMETGAVVAEGAPEEVMNDPRVLESYLGRSSEIVARSNTSSFAMEAAIASVGGIASGTGEKERS